MDIVDPQKYHGRNAVSTGTPPTPLQRCGRTFLVENESTATRDLKRRSSPYRVIRGGSPVLPSRAISPAAGGFFACQGAVRKSSHSRLLLLPLRSARSSSLAPLIISAPTCRCSRPAWAAGWSGIRAARTPLGSGPDTLRGQSRAAIRAASRCSFSCSVSVNGQSACRPDP